VNGNIALKSIVIGVADPIPQRGRRNRSPRNNERPEMLPGFVPPACNQGSNANKGDPSGSAASLWDLPSRRGEKGLMTGWKSV
jgi:hypothetical protein